MDRELTGPKDWKLMCFERMRILDMVHYWSAGTHTQYQTKLNAISQFESEYDLQRRILRPTVLLRPPSGPDIGLMWLMESYSLRTSAIRGTGERKFLSNSAIRPLRSAASQYQAWDLMVAQPSSAYFDKQKRLICQSVRPTDGLGCLLFAAGIAARIGENVMPSIAIKAATMERYLRSVATFCSRSNARDPRKIEQTNNELAPVIEGVLNEVKHWENIPDRREPFTIEMLRYLIELLASQPNIHGQYSLLAAIVDWSSTGLYNGLRLSE